jgi:hypothetical protein
MSDWRLLRQAATESQHITLLLSDHYTLNLEWAQSQQYINPFDGHPYSFPEPVKKFGAGATSKRLKAPKFAARATSHVQLKDIFLFNNQAQVDIGCSGGTMASYNQRITRKLVSLIPKTNPSAVEAIAGQLLIVQVDLQPGQRQWLELQVFPDSGVLDTEAINDELDVLVPPPLTSPLRLQLFFALWGYDGDNMLGRALDGCPIYYG